MPRHSETKALPFSARQIFDLVADVESYPEFLPWCGAARIRSRKPEGPCEVIEADLIIQFKVFSERFGSRVTLNETDLTILTEYLDGPFKYLKSSWSIRDLDAGCEVDFFVDFEMKNPILQKVVGVVFGEAMQRIVRAFEDRATALYG